MRQLGARDPLPSIMLVEAVYADPPRSYHNASHIVDCLEQFDAFGLSAESSGRQSSFPEVEAAIWFHDAVYDSKAKDNEEQSARFMERLLLDAHVLGATIERIAQLILATKHQSQPENPDAALITDIDLSILGRAPADFEAYDLAIREEYSWVPLEDYRNGRSKVLKHFLALKPIFQTPFFQELYEEQARANLKRTIAELES